MSALIREVIATHPVHGEVVRHDILCGRHQWYVDHQFVPEKTQQIRTQAITRLGEHLRAYGKTWDDIECLAFPPFPGIRGGYIDKEGIEH